MGRGETLRAELAKRAGRRLPAARRRSALTTFLRDGFAVFGAVVTLAAVLVAAFAPSLAPYDPLLLFAQSEGETPHLPPFWSEGSDPRFKLGTDSFGVDMLSLLIYATRVSILVGLNAVALVALAGTALGLLAGWFGRLRDDLVMRAADLVESIPSLLVYALLMMVLDDSILARPFEGTLLTSLVLSTVGWTSIARLVRGQVLVIKNREWILAARATGVPARRILRRHVLPHTLAPVLVAASFQIPTVMLAQGFLSVVRIGVTPPGLGDVIFNEFPHTVLTPQFVLMPTLLVVIISLGASALADGVQKVLQPW